MEDDKDKILSAEEFLKEFGKALNEAFESAKREEFLMKIEEGIKYGIQLELF